jgi:hypothetical protein
MRRMNAIYIVGHEWVSSLLFQFNVYSVSTDNILKWICDFDYKDSEGFCPFQNMHVEYVRINQLRSLISDQQNNQSRHLIGVCR